MPPGTVIGHVHLHVGDLAIASDFFGEALGLDTTVWDYPGALFFAARGYHHHLGTNIWAGPDAQPPTEEDAQLLEWTIELPEPTSLGPLADSLTRAGRPVEPIDGAGTGTDMSHSGSVGNSTPSGGQSSRLARRTAVMMSATCNPARSSGLTRTNDYQAARRKCR